jgi:hypothetical protein
LATYRRVRIYRSLTSSARIVLQYERLVPWVQPWRFTLIADDSTGITSEDIAAVVMNCMSHSVTMVELALDFPALSEVDRDFVLRFGRFGKSHRKLNIGGSTYLRYGSRASPKLVRCYFKSEINSYRVEVESHAVLLKNFGISKVADLGTIARKLVPGHLQFVSFRWGILERHLARKFGSDGQRILEKAQQKSVSLQRATRFLTREGVTNVNRFLKPKAINGDIELALDRWAARFTPDVLDPRKSDVRE